jgi:HAMP domain-containing protein
VTRLMLFSVLTIVGFLGNYFYLPILPGVDFLFGSVFVLLIFQIYGFWEALISSLLVSTYTLILWGHPFGILMFALEIVFLELWTGKQKEWGLITAGVLYWLIVAPIVISALLWGVVHYEFQDTVLIAMKLSVNGIVNFVTALLLILFTPLKTLTAEGRAECTSSTAALLFVVGAAIAVVSVIFTTFSHGYAFLHETQFVSESLVEHYITDLVYTFGVLGISIALIWLVTRYFAAPLLELSTITTKLANSQGIVESISWPHSSIGEVRQLTKNVQLLVSRWNQHIRDLEQAKASYEYLSKMIL